MMIEFQCGNLVSDTHEVCGNRIIVSDELTGDKVTCAKCQQLVEVPVATKAHPEPPRGISRNQAPPSLKKRRLALGKKPKKSKRTASRESKKHSDQVSSHGDRDSSESEPDDEYRLAEAAPPKTADSGKSPLEIPDTNPNNKPSGRKAKLSNRTGAAKPGSGDQNKVSTLRCTRCGASMDEAGFCHSCGASEMVTSTSELEKKQTPTKQASPEQDRKVKVRLAGFQLWFVNTISEAIPFRMLEMALHAAVAFVTIAFCVAAVFLASGVWKLLFLLMILTVAGFYVALVIQGHRLATQFDAKLAWFQKPFWYGILMFARMTKWKTNDSSLAGRIVLDQRGTDLDMDELINLESFHKCQVLDLAGTSITDEGLARLRSHAHLRCLVLRNTQVTHAGVQRLQQSKRKVWIWY